MPQFAPTTNGRQRLAHGQVLPRHRHDSAYVAVVLEGGYEEAGDRGRFRVEAGDVLFHDRFEAHANRVSRQGAHLLNLRWPGGGRRLAPYGRVADPDQLVRAVERDGLRAALPWLEQSRASAPIAADWPDILAADLAANPSLVLERWCAERGLAAATVSRGFRQVYGVSPSRFRLEVRTSQAWAEIVGGRRALVDVALQCGFADQAHMTRAVRAVTGWPAGAWRRPHQMDSRRPAPSLI